MVKHVIFGKLKDMTLFAKKVALVVSYIELLRHEFPH